MVFEGPVTLKTPLSAVLFDWLVGPAGFCAPVFGMPPEIISVLPGDPWRCSSAFRARLPPGPDVGAPGREGLANLFVHDGFM